MGIIYEKSISNEYGKSFSHYSDLAKEYNQYGKEEKKIQKKHSQYLISDRNAGGVPIFRGEDGESVLIDQTDTHSLIIGSTGSKKTRLIAMPTVEILASAGESMIISDPKAEIYTRTVEVLQKQNYKIQVLNLRRPAYSCRWNPLSIPYEFYCSGEIDKAHEFANDVALNLIGESNSKDVFWDNSAASVFFGLTMLLFRICDFLKLPSRYVNIKNIIELRVFMFDVKFGRPVLSKLWEFAKEDPIIQSALIGTIETANDTRAGILSTFDTAIRGFCIQPNLLSMLESDEFEWDAFMEQKTAVFMILPDEKTNYHKLVSLLIKQSYEYFIYLAQQGAHEDGINTGHIPIRINYILDEFSSLPTIKDFSTMITAARSRNIRFDLFIQSKHQLERRYKEDTETIMANCGNWFFLTTRELPLLKDISEICGTKNGRPLLTVSLLQRLDKSTGEVLVLCPRKKPCIALLPDIDFYDNNQYHLIHLEKKVCMMEIDETDIREILKEIFPQERMGTILPNQKMSVPLSNQEIDEMIAEIDKKLEELDREEKEMKQNQEEKNECN